MSVDTECWSILSVGMLSVGILSFGMLSAGILSVVMLSVSFPYCNGECLVFSF